jgi:hypothetical protein
LELNELRLIAVDGTQLGVLPGSRALELAAQDGLELVEVAPKASPPVWRLVRQQSIVVAASRRQEAASREPPATSAEPAEESDEEKRVAAVRKRAALGKKPRVKEVRLLDWFQEDNVVVKINNEAIMGLPTWPLPGPYLAPGPSGAAAGSVSRARCSGQNEERGQLLGQGLRGQGESGGEVGAAQTRGASRSDTAVRRAGYK